MLQLLFYVYIDNWGLIRKYEENLIAHVVIKSRFTKGQKISFIDIEQY